MPNNISAETPVNNAGIWYCEIIKDEVNLTEGGIDRDVPVEGLTNVEAFASDTKELSSSAPIHEDLRLPLVNIAGTNSYYAYPQGAALREHLLPAFLDELIYIHFRTTDEEWHEVAETRLVDQRNATN